MNYPRKEMNLDPESENSRENPHKEFVRKHHLELINRVLAGEMTAEQLANELAEKIVELEDQSDHDRLTGLLNLQGFADALTGDLVIVQQHDIPAYLGFFDGDKLKQLNDTRGKLVGNRVIETYAEQLKELTKKYPHLPLLMGRFGGDEFMLFIVGAGRNEAATVFEDLRQSIPPAIKQNLNDPSLESTISMGVVKVQPQDNALTLIDRADRNLKEAKLNRNRVIFEDYPTSVRR